MKLEKLLLLEGEAASYCSPQFNLTISVFENAQTWLVVTLESSDAPLDTAAIAAQLKVKEADVCRFLHCEPGERIIACKGDSDGSLAKIRWLCLTGFASAVRQHGESA